jgi:hypothetical protein
MWRLCFGFVVACGSSSQPADQGSGSSTAGTGSVSTPVVTAASPNAFFRTVSTYIVGTTGDDISDRVIANQAELIRSTFRPAAKTLRDTDVGAAWPANPVVYGGAHVNAAIAAIAKDLPFEITANKLVIGGRTFEGDGYALLTLVPARAGKYPQFMLYAGTGTPRCRRDQRRVREERRADHHRRRVRAADHRNLEHRPRRHRHGTTRHAPSAGSRGARARARSRARR